MTKNDATNIAAQILIKIFGNDLSAVKTIASAHNASIDGMKEGDSVLASALIEAQNFIQELLDIITVEDKNAN